MSFDTLQYSQLNVYHESAHAGRFERWPQIILYACKYVGITARASVMFHGGWLLVSSIDGTAFAVESGRYGAIRSRHGAKPSIETQTFCITAMRLRRREQINRMRVQAQHAIRDRCPKLQDAPRQGELRGVGPAELRDDVGSHMLLGKRDCSTVAPNHGNHESHDRSFQKPMHSV